MKRILFFLSMLIYLSAFSQGNWTLSGTKNRWGNGMTFSSKSNSQLSGFNNASDSILLQIKRTLQRPVFRYNVSDTFNTIAYLTDIPSVDSPKLKIATWGDSFTSPGIWQDYLTGWLGYTYYNGGVAGEDMPAIKARFMAHPELWSNPTIIWGGRNGFPDSATVIADISEMVDTLIAHNNTRFFVVSICMPSTAPIGTGDHNLILAINYRLANLFPNNYIDVNSFLISKYNPSIPQDVIDYANQVIPSSLRLTGDNTHLNDTGYYWTAYRFDQSISTLLGNSIQYFQNVTSGYVQVTSLNRNTLANGLELGYDSVARIGYLGVRTNTDSTQRPLVIQNGEADVSIIPGGGGDLTIGATNILATSNIIQTGNLTNTGTIGTSNVSISAMGTLTAITPLFVMYNAPDGGLLQRSTVSDVQGFLGLSNYLLKSDTSAMLLPYLRKTDTANMLTNYLRKTDTTLMLSNYLRKTDTSTMLSPYVRGTGSANYLTRWTGTRTQDSVFILSDGGRYRVGASGTPGSGFDIQNSISGLPATSGSAARGGLRVSNSGNIAVDFGIVNAGQGWVQVSDAGSYASNFPLLLNPNGGKVAINTTTSPSNELQVAGTIGTTNLVASGNMTITGESKLGGGLILGYVEVSSTYSALTSDIIINCTSGTFTVTLPGSLSVVPGKTYVVKNSGLGTITVDAASGTVNGSNVSLAAGVAYNITATTSTNWIIW